MLLLLLRELDGSSNSKLNDVSDSQVEQGGLKFADEGNRSPKNKY